MPMAYSLNGLVMDEQYPDDFGVQWSMAVTGWNGSPDTRLASGEKPNEDGEDEGPQYYNARQLGLTIWGRAMDGQESTIRQAGARLGALLDVGQSVEMQSQEDSPLTCTGRRRGRLLMSYDVNRLTASAVISCKDPRKYGTSQQVGTTLPIRSGLVAPLVAPLAVGGTGGSVVVSNTGDYPTPGILNFVGPIPGPFYALNTRENKREAYAMSLAVGETLVVNLRNGSALLNGIANRKGLRTFDSQRWYFRKGDTTILFGAAGFDVGQLIVSYAPAWMN